MSVPEHSWDDDSRAATGHRRDWVPGLIGVVSLVGVAMLVRFMDYHHWWLRGQYEVLSLILFATIVGAICVGWVTLLRATLPSCPSQVWSRIMSALFFTALGVKVGGRYVHLCEAGSSLLEGAALLGTPVLVGTIVFICKRRVLGYCVATCLLVVIWFLARPYLDWVHCT